MNTELKLYDVHAQLEKYFVLFIFYCHPSLIVKATPVVPAQVMTRWDLKVSNPPPTTPGQTMPNQNIFLCYQPVLALPAHQTLTFYLNLSDSLLANI